MLDSHDGLSPQDWSRDGRFLLYTASSNDPQAASESDLWVLPMSGDRKPSPFLRTPFREFHAQFSPDVKWVAYASNESGRSEVYVEPVPGPGGRWQISNEGGEQPRWVRNGAEIVYRSGTKMMSVSVQVQRTFRAAKPILLFDHNFDRGGSVPGFDVSPDGQLFVMTRSEHPSPTEIRVVVGWPNESHVQ